MHANRDFMNSGWDDLLPHQAITLNLIASTATSDDINGNLDHLVNATVGADNNLMFDGLDGPLAWGWEITEDPKQQELDAARQGRFETAVAGTGRVAPKTFRDLFHLLADLGALTHTSTAGVEQWRMPDLLPLPEDVLPLPEEWVNQQAELRWRAAHSETEQAILCHLSDDLGYPDQVWTSIAQLAAATLAEPDSVRNALPPFLRSGEVQMLGGDTEPVDPLTLSDDGGFLLIPDWMRFGECRLRVFHGADEDDE